MNKLKNIVNKLISSHGTENLFDFLTKSISLSELNTLMLAVNKEKVKKIKPNDLIRNFGSNRFVSPVNLDPLAFRKFEDAILTSITTTDFTFKEFSPLAPLGTCSAIARVSQNNVLSALRNTEVVSDITNVMALYAAHKIKSERIKLIKLGIVHRLVRCQQFDDPNFTAHFKVLSLISAGFDKGNYQFELDQIIDHLNAYSDILQSILPGMDTVLLEIKILSVQAKQAEPLLRKKLLEEQPITNCSIVTEIETENSYYQDFRFRIIYSMDSEQHGVIDGGMVDWTQQLLQNKKSRMLISGLGSEYLYRLLKGKANS